MLRSAAIRIRAVLLVGAALLGSACGPGACGEAARPESSGDVPVAAEALRPAPGTARIELVDGRISVWSNGAPLLEVLEQLAERGRFELLGDDIGGTTLTLRIEDAALADALRLLLAGVPHRSPGAIRS